jgi:hypothetical protein
LERDIAVESVMDTDRAPEFIYHYTTTKGLIGIVKSKKIRATDIEFMNDAQEGRFGRSELRSALLEEASNIRAADSDGTGGAEDSRATVMESAADHLKPGGIFAERQYYFTYACCFCDNGDLLSQWRGYSGTGGYCIGFRTSALRACELPDIVDGHDRTELRLVRVEYGPDAREEMISKVVSTIAPDPVGHPGSRGYGQAGKVVLPELSSVKHEAFSEEREWRLLAVTDQHGPEFRCGSMGPTPYLELSFPVASIVEVVIGPGANHEVRRLGVERLLGSNGLEGIVVKDSAVPFRS